MLKPKSLVQLFQMCQQTIDLFQLYPKQQFLLSSELPNSFINDWDWKFAGNTVSYLSLILTWNKVVIYKHDINLRNLRMKSAKNQIFEICLLSGRILQLLKADYFFSFEIAAVSSRLF